MRRERPKAPAQCLAPPSARCQPHTPERIIRGKGGRSPTACVCAGRYPYPPSSAISWEGVYRWHLMDHAFDHSVPYRIKRAYVLSGAFGALFFVGAFQIAIQTKRGDAMVLFGIVTVLCTVQPSPIPESSVLRGTSPTKESFSLRP